MDREPLKRTPGLVAVARREIVRIGSSRIDRMLLFVLPPLAFVLLSATFWSRFPTDLPVAVADEDRSLLSRQVIRSVDATKSMRVSIVTPSPEAAFDEVLAGRAYAVVVVPRGLERDVRRGAAPKLVAFTNSQTLLVGSILRRDLRAVAATLSARLEVSARRAIGETPRVALRRLEPIRTERHPLFNPELDYLAYLLPALLAAVLQVFAVVAAVNALGVELRDGTAREWLEIAGGSVVRAVFGKLGPQALHFSLLALAMDLVLFRLLGIPLHGSAFTVALATVLLVLACAGLAVPLVAFPANLRFASSSAAFVTGPAFAFAGLTFPLIGMPPLARAWAEVLPLTHWVQLVLEQAVRGAPPAAALPRLAALALLATVLPLAALPRLRRTMTDESCWGRA